MSPEEALQKVTEIIQKKYGQGLPTKDALIEEYQNEVRSKIGDILFFIGLAEDVGSSSAFANSLYFLNEQFPNFKIDLTNAIQNYFKGNLSLSDLYAYGKSYGYSSNQIDLMIKAKQEELDLSSLLDLYFRGEISESDLYTKAKAIGFEKDRVDLLRKLREYYPNVNDLITFVVREAFNEEAVRKNQQDYGLDEAWLRIEKYAKAQGLTKDTFKLFWRSHWELPSATMVFDMFRRGLISRDEARSLLIYLDYMPAYIDKILTLLTEVIPRVDIRRLYQAKLVDRDKVKKTYLALGYSEEDAELMTKFTELNYSEVDKDLSKSEVLEGFRDGVLTLDKAKNWLMKLGYDEDEADYLLSLEQAKKQRTSLKQKVEYAKTNYIQGYWTKDDFVDYLNKLDLPGSTIKDILINVDEEKIKNLKLPSKEEILRWFKKELIDEEIATNLLVLLGYPQVIAKMYILEIYYDMKQGA